MNLRSFNHLDQSSATNSYHRRDDRRLSSSPLKSPMPTSLQTARRNQLPKHVCVRLMTLVDSKQGFVSDDQLAIGRETFRKFIDARDQSQLRMDQMDEV